MRRVAQVYFAKFNINSEIYEIYKEPKLLNEILGDIAGSLTNSKSIVLEKQTDLPSDATESGAQDERIKFVDLEYNRGKNYIFGRIARIGAKESEKYVPSLDTVQTTIEDNHACTATFYFDLSSEIIAFITRQEIGYKQFLQYFKNLVELCMPDIEVELFLEHNMAELMEKIKRFEVVSKVTTTLIPPNSNNDEDMDSLFGICAPDMKTAGITKIVQVATGSIKRLKKGIDIGSDWFSRIMKFGVARGYGYVDVEGKDSSGLKYTVSSNEDALFKKPISDQGKHAFDELQSVARSGISELISQRMRMSQYEQDDK